MKLEVYLADKGIGVKEFSIRLGCTANYLSRVMHKHVVPSKRLVDDIKRLTCGLVEMPYSMKGKPKPLKLQQIDMFNADF